MANQVVMIGFAKYQSLDENFAKLVQHLQKGFFLFTACSDSDTETENLKQAEALQKQLKEMELSYIALLGIYEDETDKQTILFTAVPYGGVGKPEIFLAKAKKMAGMYKQNYFFAKLGQHENIKLYQREKREGSNINFEECAVAVENMEDLIAFYGKNKNMQCVFKGYRVPSSWLNAVKMEKEGIVWH